MKATKGRESFTVCTRCNRESKVFTLREASGLYCRFCIEDIQNLPDPAVGMCYFIRAYDPSNGEPHAHTVKVKRESRNEVGSWVVDHKNNLGFHENIVWSHQTFYHKPYEVQLPVTEVISRLDFVD